MGAPKTTGTTAGASSPTREILGEFVWARDATGGAGTRARNQRHFIEVAPLSQEEHCPEVHWASTVQKQPDCNWAQIPGAAIAPGTASGLVWQNRTRTHPSPRTGLPSGASTPPGKDHPGRPAFPLGHRSTGSRCRRDLVLRERTFVRRSSLPPRLSYRGRLR